MSKQITITAILVSLLLISTGCSQTDSQSSVASKPDIPHDFHLRFIRGGDPVLGTLLFTEYNVSRDGSLIVKSEYVREIVTEERSLTEEQVAVLWDRVDGAKLPEFAKNVTDLRNRCLIRATDQARRELEVQWDGKQVKINDEFDPKQCEEVVALTTLTKDLPNLLNGRLIKSDSKKAPWPRD